MAGTDTQNYHFGAAPEEDMFQKMIDEIFSSMLNYFIIDDEILIAVFIEQSKDHDKKLEMVLWVYRQAFLKLNKGVFLDVLAFTSLVR